MKAPEVYRCIRSEVGDVVSALGFRPLKSGWLAFHRPVGSQHLAFWFQCNRWGWDKYSGSTFTVEFQLHPTLDLGQKDNRRIQSFLTPDELETARMMQNQVVARIPPPPREWVSQFEAHARKSANPDALLEGFRRQWAPIDGPLRPNHDLWFRYWLEEDVRSWATFVKTVLPRIDADMQRAGDGSS